jgi:hypothetical protein
MMIVLPSAIDLSLGLRPPWLLVTIVSLERRTLLFSTEPPIKSTGKASRTNDINVNISLSITGS